MPDQFISLPLTPQTLPLGFCATTWQAILNSFAANLFVNLPIQNSQLIISATKPAPEFEGTAAWLQLSPNGSPVRIYWFAQGAWISAHTINTGLTQWWFDALPDFTTFDGGDANGLGIYSGPMWQLAQRLDGTVIAAQFPIAAGTLPSGLVLNNGDAGGEEKHILTPAETAIPDHKHLNSMFVSPGGVEWDHNAGSVPADSNSVPAQGNTPVTRVQPYTGNGVPPDPSNPVAVQGHQNMPVFCVGFLLQRTIRAFYKV